MLNPKFSSSTRFMLYQISYGAAYQQPKTVLRDTQTGKQKEFSTIFSYAHFSADERFIFLLRGDTLTTLELKGNGSTSISGVQGLQCSGNRAAFFFKADPTTLLISEGPGDIKYRFPNVERVISSRGDDGFLMVLEEGNRQKLMRLRSSGRAVEHLADSKGFRTFTFDAQHGAWIFFAGSEDSTVVYKFGTTGTRVERYLINLPPKLREASAPDAPAFLSRNGDALFFTLKNTTSSPVPAGTFPTGLAITGLNAPNLTIHHYLEPLMHDYHQTKTDTLWSPVCLLNFDTRKCTQITTANEKLLDHGPQWAWIAKSRGQGNLAEDDWNKNAGLDIQLKSLQGNSNMELPSKRTSLSPSGKQLLYFDASSNGFWLFDCRNQEKRFLTHSIQTDWYSGNLDHQYRPITNISNIKWDLSENWAYIQDRYDLWKVDVKGKRPPVCISKGYGKAHRWKFSLAPGTALPVEGQKRAILMGQQPAGVSSGFFSTSLDGSTEPILLHQRDELLSFVTGSAGYRIFRASNAAKGITYLRTWDYIHFECLLISSPQKGYNWLSSELHMFRDSSGREMSGILYKPQDFDPSKRYPLIINCYQRIGDSMNELPNPSHAAGDLNIAWMVSHGYLVFFPDIINEPNKGGESGLRHILSAVEYLRELKFVDPKRIGLSGHSYGGFETTYAISHSQLFAAAYAGSPVTDMIVNYALTPGMYHHGQTGITTLLWEDPKPYFENSPIFRVNYVRTPLLLLGNSEDFLAPQALEFYNAMRRLGKPCWMLSYKGENHSLSAAAGLDHTIRVQQFFDHYLKGSPLPEWMLRPGSMGTGLAAGLQFTGEGILNHKARAIADSLLNRPVLQVEF